MPPMMRTRSVGRPVAESRGGGTGERVGRGGRGRGPRGGNDEHVDELNGQGNDQGLGANRNVKGVNENVEGVNGGVGGASDFLTIIAQQLQILLPAIFAQGGVVVLTRWIKKMESVQDMSGCSIDQKVTYTAGSFVGKALTWWNSQIRTLSREVAVSMAWNDFKFMMIEEFCPSYEMQKLEIELWNHAVVRAVHAAYTDRFHELAKMLAATEPKTMQIFGALTDEAIRNGSIKRLRKEEIWGNLARKRMVGMILRGLGLEMLLLQPQTLDCRVVARNVNPLNVRNPTPARGECYECRSTDHLKPACPRLNRAQGPRGNRPNQVVANNRGQGRRNQGNQARGRAFMLGAEEAHQDLNIMTGTFTLNNHFPTTLFDSGADYSFVSTTFILLLGIEPSELGFRSEIEVASGLLVEIENVIKGCKLEIKGHVFDIDLIPFGHGSFDVII
ncbi:putative reverse transcriptase domain-containing protein, partial [Tanacetum coccineum]